MLKSLERSFIFFMKDKASIAQVTKIICQCFKIFLKIVAISRLIIIANNDQFEL